MAGDIFHGTHVVGKGALDSGLVQQDPNDPLVQKIADLEDRITTLELALRSNGHDEGLHNAQAYSEDQAKFYDEILKGDSYRDLSTIWVMPGYKPVVPKVWSRWMSLLHPANQRVHRMWIENCEVGDAYQKSIEKIMENPVLRDYSYVLTLEADNLVPPMAVMQMLIDIHEADVDVLGAMYWGKQPGGVPMAYGKFGELPRTYRPFQPPAHCVTRVNATGMGCTLFRMSAFERVSSPWFKTYQEWTPGSGAESLLTQDIYFADKAAREAGLKFAVTTKVLVGHLDERTGIVW